MPRREFVDFHAFSAGDDGVAQIVVVYRALPGDTTNYLEFRLGSKIHRLGRIIDGDLISFGLRSQNIVPATRLKK